MANKFGIQTVMQSVRDMVAGTLDLAYPPQCLSCNAVPDSGSGMQMCTACFDSFTVLQAPYCAKCAAPVPEFRQPDFRCSSCSSLSAHFKRAFATGLFQGSLQKAIHNFKFHHARDAARHFASMMAATAHNEIPADVREHLDGFVIVPSHPHAAARRGYCHMELLARHLRRHLSWPYWPKRLAVKEYREAQYRMDSKAARFENVKDNYIYASRRSISGKSVLLVDDVMTTGATAAACSKALLAAGAKEVHVLVLARAHKALA